MSAISDKAELANCRTYIHRNTSFVSNQFACREQQFLALTSCAGAGAVTVQRQQKLTDMGATVHVRKLHWSAEEWKIQSWCHNLEMREPLEEAG